MAEIEADVEVFCSNLESCLPNLWRFLSVVDAGSMARAADQLFKARSAVARSMTELEQTIGAPLFERSSRGLLLTQYGEIVAARARRIHDELQVAAEELIASSRSPRLSHATVTNVLCNGRRLRLVIHVSQLQTIASSSNLLGMTPAGASMALSRIESALGYPLFERRANGMAATETADRLVVRAKRVFSELRSMHSDLSALSGHLIGVVVIGTLSFGRTYVLPNAIRSTVLGNPGLRVTTEEGSYAQLMRGLRSGDVDVVVGLVPATAIPPDLRVEPLFPDRLGIFVRKDHPLSSQQHILISDVVREQWIMPKMGSAARSVIDASFRRAELQAPTPAVETSDLTIIREILIGSDMLSVASPHQLMSEIRGGSLVELPIDIGDTTRKVGLILRDSAMLSPVAAGVIDAIRACAKELCSQYAPPTSDDHSGSAG